MAGEITDNDLTGNYKELLEQLEKYSLSELKARISSDIKPLKDSLKSLPLTIKTLEENLPNVEEAVSAKKAIEDYKNQISDIDKELQGSAESIKPLIEKRNKDLQEISDWERNIRTEKEKYDEEQNKISASILSEICSVTEENKNIDNKNEENRRKRRVLSDKIKSLNIDLGILNERRNNLLNKLDECLEKEFSADKCSYCGQTLPDDKLELLKKEFYKQVEIEKENIIKEGLNVKARIDDVTKIIEECEASLADIPTALLEKKDLSTLQKEYDEVQQNVIPFEQTEKYKSLVSLLEEKKKTITTIPEQDNSGLLSMKKALMSNIEEESKKMGLIDERKKQEKKIEEFKKQLKDTANALAEQEKLDNQIKTYEEERAKIISDRVNKFFKRCNITMMSQDKSGVWIPDCVIIGIDGAIAATSNGAERILIGIDIANAFADFFNVSLPLFVDDMNLIDSSNEIKTCHQLIELIVNDSDNELRVEYLSLIHI